MNTAILPKAIALFFLLITGKLMTAQPQIPGVTIIGPVVTCSSGFENYEVIGPFPPGFISYQWSGTYFQAQPGQTYSGSTLISNYNPYVTVFFPYFIDGAGVYTAQLNLNVLVDGVLVHSQSFSILVGGYGANAQLNSGSYCPGAQFYLCTQKACVGTSITYSAIPAAAAPETTWEVEGATAYTVNPDNSITVLWGQLGQGRVFASYSLSECIYMQHRQVACIEILQQPQAVFTTDPPPQEEGVLKICKGQSVRFINQTEDASNYQWILGNSISTSANPVNSYDTPGTYEVTLRADNGCDCLDTATMTIIVEDVFSPGIDCKGTVCAGDTATYHTDSDCGNNIWSINELGTVVAGGEIHDNFITVVWQNGGSGEVQLRVENCPGQVACVDATVISIPIIDNQVDIIGPSNVCLNESASYFIPDYKGTSIQWSTIGGTLISGQGESRATIKWPPLSAPTQRKVIVNYNNCYLGCRGSDTLDVFVRPVLRIQGNIETCAWGSSNHSALAEEQLAACYWTVLNSDSVAVWSSSGAVSSVNVPWDQAGIYTLIAVPADPQAFCTPIAGARIRVFDAPPAPEGIAGDFQICPEQTHFYSPVGALQGAQLNWQIINGADTVHSSGTWASATWGISPPYQINLTQTGIVAGCTSPPAILTPYPIQSAITINGPIETCTSSTSTYAVSAIDGNFQWSIQPAGAGIIISGQNSPNIVIQWNFSGPATISLSFCNFQSFLAVHVHTTDAPEVVAPALLCDNETAEVHTITPFAAYSWKTDSDSLVSNLATPALSPGYYYLEAANVYGCTSKAVFHIDALPAPNLRISSPSLQCLNLGMPRFYALNTVTGYEYEWLFNGSTTSHTGPTMLATQAGDYQARVTDMNGCATLSNMLEVEADCLPGGGPANGNLPQELLACLINGPANIDITPTTDCYTRQYSAQVNNALPGTIRWYFSDEQTGSPVYGATVNHTYGEAGFYNVIFLADFNVNGVTTSCGLLKFDTIWTRADFAHTSACAGTPMLFIDRSTFIPVLSSITSWHWDFGDPASGAANISLQSNPSHVYMQAGFYQVTLTVTSSSGCQSVFTQTVEVFGPSATNMNLLPAYCLHTAQLFQAEATPTPVSWQWNFDSASGSPPLYGNSIYYQYNSTGTYTIGLQTINRYGCIGELAEEITVGADMQLLTGEITSSLNIPFCPDNTTVLTAPSGGIGWQWSTGENAPTIYVSEPGLYTVAVTDSAGCKYNPLPVNVQLLPAPNATIRAIEYDEYSTPVAYAYQYSEICEGEDVYLEIVANTNSEIQWFNGLSSMNIEFTAARGSLLPAGINDISAIVTDTTTGCSTWVPFTVVVNPSPALPVITMDPAGPVCKDTPVTYTVENPDPESVYIWNTRQIQHSITNSIPGTYYVTAHNNYNCSTQNRVTSNHVSGPNLDLIPAGCYSQCRPDTICVPTLSSPNYSTGYQWLYNGEPIPGTHGIIRLMATQSGDYNFRVTISMPWLQLHCVYYSETLHLDLYDDQSPINGSVYIDVNQNNIIDAADTLLAGIPVLLQTNGQNDQNQVSDDAGNFHFPDIGGGNYTLAVDTAQLSDDYVAVTAPVSFFHSGCDSRHIRLLITQACLPVSGYSQATFCQGDTLHLGNIDITTDTILATHQLISSSGCDSTHWLQAIVLQPSSSTFGLSACPGEDIPFAGLMLPAGTDTVLIYSNSAGCDSLVHVSVEMLPLSNTGISLSACQGSSASYNGFALPAGIDTSFVFTNAAGCDSLVHVSVEILPLSNTGISLSACQGSSASYNGFALPAGIDTSFVFTNAAGCDSLVHVSVEILPLSNTGISLSACQGSSASYNGFALPAGIDTSFVFTNAAGCDSLVHVSVEILPLSNTGISLSACQGSSASYNGFALPAGIDTSFVFTNTAGCDSVVNVVVSALPLPLFVVETQPSCPNGATGQALISDVQNGLAPYQYSINGFPPVNSPVFSGLLPGFYSFNLTDANGCQAQYNTSIPALSQLLLRSEPSHTLPCNPHEVYLLPDILSGDFDALSFQWSNGKTTPGIVVSSAGNYEVTVSNVCESQILHYTVFPAPPSNSPMIYIPNAFSPNDDGINDIFNIIPGEDVLINHFVLRIFDRWGNFIFQTTAVNNSWDGSFRGRNLNTGVYIWFLEADLVLCGEQQTIKRKGDILLMR